MEVKGQYLPIDKLRLAMGVLDPCMDDYLFIMDLNTHFYEISASAVERFNIPSSEFYLVGDALTNLVHPKDLDMLACDLADVAAGKKTRHDLQYRWMNRGGDPVWINCRGRVLASQDGTAEFLIGCINEIGRRQKADNISGLIFVSSMQETLEAHYHPEHGGFILRLDIDNFRDINEKLGMEYGNLVLRETAECIQSVLTEHQFLYHITADEFAILDLDSMTKEEARGLYHRIRKAIDQYVSENGYLAFFTISAGIVSISEMPVPDYATLMMLAEFALNEAKKQGKNTDYCYTSEAFDKFLRRKTLLQYLRQAVVQDFQGFVAYFQPVEDIRRGEPYGAEALLRFQCPEFGMVSPSEFIPLLEESSLIIPVGRWILARAMEFCKKMQETIPHFKISVNVSYIQVMKSDLIRDISALLDEYQLSADSVQIELTESGFFESDQNYIRFCASLRTLHIPLALDDFGTGYSNFHYLYHINPQVIKIDRSFTLKALNNDYEFTLLRHMTQLTHSINSKMCIEGIETAEELEKICELDPDYIQGYYFSKPLPAEVFFEKYGTH